MGLTACLATQQAATVNTQAGHVRVAAVYHSLDGVISTASRLSGSLSNLLVRLNEELKGREQLYRHSWCVCIGLMPFGLYCLSMLVIVTNPYILLDQALRFGAVYGHHHQYG